MMDLLTPTNHAGAYEWAAVLFAHVTVGLGLVAIVAALLDWLEADSPGIVALHVVTVAYALVWEGIIQGYGAGFADAAVDTFAVFIGGLLGVSAWGRRGIAVAASLLALAGVLWAGVRARK